MSKTFGQYGTANYNFYTYTKEGFVFLVMVDSSVTHTNNFIVRNKNRCLLSEKNPIIILQKV
jgi:hypothetical protein